MSLIDIEDQALKKPKAQVKNSVVKGKTIEKILVIEDDKRTRTTIRQVLESAGYNVIEADNGKIGIDLYKKEPIALVITDMLMPVVDGFETIKEIRKLSSSQKIIAISGGGHIDSDHYLNIAKKLNVTNWLSKPFGKKGLLETIQKTFQDE